MLQRLEDLTRISAPIVDLDTLREQRLGKLRAEIKARDLDLLILTNPVSLRYALNMRDYALFNTHIPTSYAFISQEGPVILFGAYGPPPLVDEARPGRPISYFDGGEALKDIAPLFAEDCLGYLNEIGVSTKKIAVEYVNPSITQALEAKGAEVSDGVCVAEYTRAIKLPIELTCMRHAVAVAELGLETVRNAIRPGITENDLLALFNYVNVSHDGDWIDGRMISSGHRINPWCQEASMKKLEAGDLVGMDTDMIGPYGYFADISRTFFCGPGQPSKRQKQLYRLAVEEVEYNKKLLKPGLGFYEFAETALKIDEEFQANAYTCLLHGAGMCDEYPRVNHTFRKAVPYDGVYEAGMVVTVESYMGAVGEPNGVKIEQQMLITEDGAEQLSQFPYEECLLD